MPAPTLALSDAELAMLRRWRDDCASFVRENFGVTPDPWQQEALDAWNTHSSMLLLACKGPGKTAFLAWMALHFIATWPNAQVVCTSVSRENLRDNLWKEISYWYDKSPFLKAFFKLTTERVACKAAENTWWISARGWAKGADEKEQTNVLAGFHGDNVMFAGDEASSYSRGFVAAVEAIQANMVAGSGRRAKILFAANPTDPLGAIHDIDVSQRARDGVDEPGRYKVVNITADPDDPKRTPRVSVEWAREQIRKWGRENPYVLVNVFGRFPPHAINSLLSVDDVKAAVERSKMLTPAMYEDAQPRLGIDPSRYGDDPTVIVRRQGLMCFPIVWEHRHEKGAKVGTDIKHAVLKSENVARTEARYIDATGGWGASAWDALQTHGLDIENVQFHGPPQDDMYANRRAEIWMRMARWIAGGGAIPNDPDLIEELCTATYTHTPSNKFLLEPKDDMKDRLGRSPNKADALALTFADLEKPRRDRDPAEIMLERVIDRDHPRVNNGLDYDPLKATWG